MIKEDLKGMKSVRMGQEKIHTTVGQVRVQTKANKANFI